MFTDESYTSTTLSFLFLVVSFFDTLSEPSCFFFLFFSETARHTPSLAYPPRHEVDADGKPTHVKGLVVNSGTKGEEYREYDIVVAATDVPGIKKLLPENFRK